MMGPGFAFAVCCAVSNVAHAATFVVDDAGDTPDVAPGDGVCLDAFGACTVRAAVDEANATPGHDEVLLGARTVFLTAGPLWVTEALVLEGMDWRDSAINGGGLDRVLVIDALEEVEVRGVTLRNGAAPGADGGCVLAWSEVAFDAVRWQGCTADRGGALWADASVQVLDSLAADNQAVADGGAFWLGGSAVVDATAFARNEADEGAGIMFVAAASGALSVTGCRFSGHYSRDGWIVSASGDLAVQSSVFMDNDVNTDVVQEGFFVTSVTDVVSARSGRYGSIASYGDLTVEGVTADVGIVALGVGAVVDNRDTLVVTSEDVAIHIRDAADVTLRNVNLFANRWTLALIATGSAHLESVMVTSFERGVIIESGEVEIVSSHIRYGLDMYYSANVTLRDVDVTGHEGLGPAIWVESGSELTIEDSRIRGNYNDFCWYCWVDFGGGLVNEGLTTVRDSRFLGNYASNRGGAVYNLGHLVVEDSSFDHNSSMAGGAIYNEGGDLELTRVTFAGNVAEEGGAVFMSGGTITALDSVFHHNAAWFAWSGQGGAVLGHGDGLFQNTTFMSNFAATDGGALALTGPGSLLLDQVTVAYNHADGDGDGTGVAALWVGDDQEVVVHNGLLSSNADSADGAACAVAGTGSLVSDGWNVVSVDCGAFTGPGDQAGTAGSPLDGALGQATSPSGVRVAVPLAGSPAIDAAADCTATDQLGRVRPVDGDGDGTAACDIGAIEVQ
jgi:predicted outer membrane repeat protein